MHCPRCGQQQITDQTQFCSRCGFRLGLVVELLAHEGTLPQLADLNKKGIFTRRNGVAFSLLWCLFFLFIMTPLGGIAGIDELAAVSAVVGIFGGLIILVSSMLFLKKSTSFPGLNAVNVNQVESRNLYGTPGQNALPPQQTHPVSNYIPPEASWKAPDTGDLVRPSSVTEGTTKLLKKED